ncbi:MAG: hypothetical protein HY821_07550 [Acidobacteria bacterium]|nr:hypothetical protein [Acidobacteriota bacterium]
MELKSKLKWALAGYALLGVAAWFTLDGRFRWIVLVILAAFAVKSWVATKKEQLG